MANKIISEQTDAENGREIEHKHRIIPFWGTAEITEIRPNSVEQVKQNLNLQSKSIFDI